MEDRCTLNVSANSIARVLGVLALLLVLASIAGQLSTYLLGHGRLLGLVGLFNVDVEFNVPTAFSVGLLLVAALLLGTIATLEYKKTEGGWFYWSVLSVGFVLMGVDEGWSLHERLDKPVRAALGNSKLGIFYHAWVVPALVLVVLLAFLFSRFLLRLPRTTMVRFLIAGALYLGGAIGIELIGGYYAEQHGYLNLTYSVIVTVEESLEMAGSIFFIWALLAHAAQRYGDVRLQFG